MATPSEPRFVGRGAQFNPPNRFTRIEFEDDFADLDPEEQAERAHRRIPTEYYVDTSKTIITENDSPDVGCRYTLNPYRGCVHGCSYCFARPTHEYFDLSAGLDFETKIFVKLQAAELFREWLTRPGWTAEPIMMSGVTDCYQPIEGKLALTRRCLQVARDAGQPMVVVTKNALITRDLDVLKEMASAGTVHVSISLTTLDESLARKMEPRTSCPAARLRAIAALSHAGIPTSVLVAPVIPGLNDHEIPSLLREAASAGARSAGYVLLRLPFTVAPVFLDWLQRSFPERASRIEACIRATRGGKLYESEFGLRMVGRGILAEQIRRTFDLFARRYGLDQPLPPLNREGFRPPTAAGRQRLLF
jgi:DNA repair photolyase